MLKASSLAMEIAVTESPVKLNELIDASANNVFVQEVRAMIFNLFNSQLLLV